MTKNSAALLKGNQTLYLLVYERNTKCLNIQLPIVMYIVMYLVVPLQYHKSIHISDFCEATTHHALSHPLFLR